MPSARLAEWLKNAPAALLEQLRGGATGTQCAKKLTLALRSAIVEPEPEVSAADEPEIKDFYTVGRAKATEAEVHLFALFIIGLGHTDSDIRTWASSVANGYGAEFDLLKNTWRPPTAKGEVAAWSQLALVMAPPVVGFRRERAHRQGGGGAAAAHCGRHLRRRGGQPAGGGTGVVRARRPVHRGVLAVLYTRRQAAAYLDGGQGDRDRRRHHDEADGGIARNPSGGRGLLGMGGRQRAQ